MRCGSVGRRVGGSAGPEQLPCEVSDFKQSANRPTRRSVKNNRMLFDTDNVDSLWRWLHAHDTVLTHDAAWLLMTLAVHDVGCSWRWNAHDAGWSLCWLLMTPTCLATQTVHDAGMLTTLLLTTLACSRRWHAHAARCSRRWLLMTLAAHYADCSWRWLFMAVSSRNAGSSWRC